MEKKAEKITEEHILKAIEREWLVEVKRSGRPNPSYQGRILKRLDGSWFLFKGYSGSEETKGGKIRVSDIIAIDNIKSKTCVHCRRTYKVETRICPSCEKSEFFMNYDAEEE